MTTPASPYVAWGLRAMAIAMKAKTGARVPLAEVYDLAEGYTAWIGQDADAARAIVRFIALLNDDAVAAGAGLHHFLSEWREGAVADVAERTEDAPGDLFPRPDPAQPQVKTTLAAASTPGTPKPSEPKVSDEEAPIRRPSAGSSSSAAKHGRADWQQRADLQ